MFRGMRTWFVLTFIPAFILVLAACTMELEVHYPQASDAGAPEKKVFAGATGGAGGFDPTPRLFGYYAGSSGTVTIPAHVYITGIGCHATTAGTLAMTLVGPWSDGGASPSIPIPAGVGWSAPPEIIGALNSLGPGSVITFTGTDSYTITYTAYAGL